MKDKIILLGSSLIFFKCGSLRSSDRSTDVLDTYSHLSIIYIFIPFHAFHHDTLIINVSNKGNYLTVHAIQHTAGSLQADVRHDHSLREEKDSPASNLLLFNCGPLSCGCDIGPNSLDQCRLTIICLQPVNEPSQKWEQPILSLFCLLRLSEKMC